ncbi:hypothetical protein OEB99_04430 [Actinotalea sp. M2MS4P-6]|uniref:LolA family protein n=1 Tax=Actinotalea sp. M2MS4P-6 TaxID=2983762 RepID=UPI0021E3B5A8|nr:hypothetical protein [Actinotalea sp. M2MS4P-6]MCV2393546.1 hypothetical protein [Actinotalea sp. M2MS4P-6]
MSGRAGFAHARSVRWLLPVAVAGAVIGTTLLAPAVAASVDLPDKTAEQLLTDLQGADVTAVQGTVVVDADLGLPSLPSVAGPHGSGLGVADLLDGTTTLRVWASHDGLRVAALGSLGETDVVTDGTQLWVWSSDDSTVTHVVPPTDAELAAARDALAAAHPGATGEDTPSVLDGAAATDPRAALANLTPDQLSTLVLAALEPTTQVTTGPATRVAGRPAYQLVLTPTDPGTLIASVTIAIDAAERVPTQLTVTSTVTGEPALTVGYTSVSFTAPDPSVFTFTPPAGATVTEPDLLSGAGKSGAGTGAGTGEDPASRATPQVVGEGWASVLVLSGSATDLAGAEAQAADSADPTLSALLTAMPQVSGDWGSGRLLTTNLLSVLLTDDGRTIVGAVDRATLEVAASSTR